MQLASATFILLVGSMPIRTRRWNDPGEPGDGFRLLVCRYRPRGVSRARETWDEWWPELGPSRELHAARYGKAPGGTVDLGQRLPFPEYRRRFLEEMAGQRFRLRALASRHAAGETVTLLCSSACADPATCHRTILAQLVTGLAGARPGG
jgi:uncharacterized protein YeaO (DUF488 family)